MKAYRQYITLGISLLLIIALVYYFPDIVAYVVVAWVLSMIGQPLMRFFQKYIKIGRFNAGPNLAALLTLLTYFLVVALLIWLFVPPLLKQINNLAHVNYADIAKKLEAPLLRLQQKLGEYGIIDSSLSLEDQMCRIFTGSLEPAYITRYFNSIIGTIGNIGVAFGSTVFITFFFLKDRGLFVNFLATLMPEQYEGKVKSAMTEIAKTLSLYFQGLLLQLLAFALTVTIALLILGIENALLIGVFAGLLNIVPYVGPIIGALFGVVFTISSNLDIASYSQLLPLIIKVILVFLGAQMLDNNITQPLIFSNTLRVHPLEIFIVVLMGAKIGGVMGMVLAIPAYMVLRVIAAVFLSEFHIVQNMRERMSEARSEEVEKPKPKRTARKKDAG